MIVSASRRSIIAALPFIALFALLTVFASGCAVDKAATPDAEMSAAVKTRDDARALQSDSQTRVKDANAILDGK